MCLFSVALVWSGLTLSLSLFLFSCLQLDVREPPHSTLSAVVVIELADCIIMLAGGGGGRKERKGNDELPVDEDDGDDVGSSGG